MYYQDEEVEKKERRKVIVIAIAAIGLGTELGKRGLKDIKDDSIKK